MTVNISKSSTINKSAVIFDLCKGKIQLIIFLFDFITNSFIDSENICFSPFSYD